MDHGKGPEVCIKGTHYIIKMADTPIYGKIFNNLLLQKQKSDDLKTKQRAKQTQALQGFID